GHAEAVPAWSIGNELDSFGLADRSVIGGKQFFAGRTECRHDDIHGMLLDVQSRILACCQDHIVVLQVACSDFAGTSLTGLKSRLSLALGQYPSGNSDGKCQP